MNLTKLFILLFGCLLLNNGISQQGGQTREFDIISNYGTPKIRSNSVLIENGFSTHVRIYFSQTTGEVWFNLKPKLATWEDPGGGFATRWLADGKEYNEGEIGMTPFYGIKLAGVTFNITVTSPGGSVDRKWFLGSGNIIIPRVKGYDINSYSITINSLESISYDQETYKRMYAAVKGYNSKLNIEKLYTEAVNAINNNQIEIAKQKITEGLNLAKSNNINDPRFQTLIDKIEAKNSDSKKETAKKQLDELYTTAKGQVTKNDKSGALATISKAESIIEKEKLTDDRFSTLKSQVEKSSDSSSKTSSDSTSSEKTESSTEESTSKNQSSQEETGPTPEEISQQQERDRLNRQQEYINNRQDAISDNIDMASMGAAQLLLAYYALGRVIYDKIDNKTGNMISAPGSAFELQLGYSISSFPIYINITEEEYDGNTYTYDQYSEKRTPFSLNMNVAINSWLLKSADKGFGVSIKGWAGQGLYFQNFHLGGEFGMKGYWGHDWLQFYAEYINGHRRLSYNDWIDPGKTQEGKARINYHQIKAGPRFSTESDWNGITRLNVDVLPIFEVYRGVQHLQYGSNPLGFYWRKGIELGLKFDNRLNFTLQINGQYPVKGDDLFGFKEYQKWSGTGFTFSVLRSLEFYNNHLTLPDRSTMYSWLSDLSIDEVRFISPSVEWITPSNRLYNGKPSMLSLKLFEYIVNTEIYDNIQLGIGGNLGVRTLNFQAKPGYYTPTVAEGYEHSQSAVTVSAPIELKYYTDFNYNKRNWLLAGLEYRKNLVKWQNNRKLELDQPKSSSNTISSIRTDGLFWKIGIGMDYAVGESFVTTGIQYKRSMHLALPGDITRVQGIELVFGLKI